ncbi:hypothetical protein F0U44_04740 [Nocardioides humilatus]|uniref:DUF4064 domain-containing protein n=1 Tax=Nocardioides humilatus TaxID=2607660 RepID=A0A5B1LLJ2_9ACTN|nr:hypothetical protein [Nocardioides humilatus]KAA1421591.1 hypothetical protein F0U44_04740 [Nocardioides humilatus]
MSEKEAPRPGQVTFAGWLIIGGSVILVATAWQRISTLHTLEFQEQLQKVLSEQPFEGTGLGTNTLETTIRVLCMIAAGAATASTILGFQALRRSTSARLALTLLAPLVLIGGFATAGFFAPMVIAGIVMLWLQPSRDWFAGRPWVPRPLVRTGPPAPRRPDPFAPQPPAASAPPPPPPAPAPPALAPPVSAEPGPYGQPFGAPPPVYPMPPAAAVRVRRPGALIGACITVWVLCSLVAGSMLVTSLVMAFAQDELFDMIEEQQPDFDYAGLSRGELATSVYITTAVVVVWCLAAIVLAVLAFRRVGWARIALAVCTGVTAVLVLAATLVNPVLVVLLVATATTLWLLLRADVAAWFKR